MRADMAGLNENSSWGSGEAPTDKPRLSSRDRGIVAGVSVLAAAAAGSAFVYAVAVTLTLFGEQPSPRESSVGVQSGWVLLWALLTPVCCWAVLRGGRRAAGGVIAWLVLLGLCRMWWFPTSLSSVLEQWVQPLWLSPYGVLPWLTLVASLAIGVLAAWRNPNRTVRLCAASLTIAILTVAASSYVNLFRHAQAEAEALTGGGISESQ
jgi:hypothetical protein